MRASSSRSSCSASSVKKTRQALTVISSPRLTSAFCSEPLHQLGNRRVIELESSGDLSLNHGVFGFGDELPGGIEQQPLGEREPRRGTHRLNVPPPAHRGEPFSFANRRSRGDPELRLAARASVVPRARAVPLGLAFPRANADPLHAAPGRTGVFRPHCTTATLVLDSSLAPCSSLSNQNSTSCTKWNSLSAIAIAIAIALAIAYRHRHRHRHRHRPSRIALRVRSGISSRRSRGASAIAIAAPQNKKCALCTK